MVISIIDALSPKFVDHDMTIWSLESKKVLKCWISVFIFSE
jgi:hypothetical protein